MLAIDKMKDINKDIEIVILPMSKMPRIIVYPTKVTVANSET